jgi:hypothetical protein
MIVSMVTTAVRLNSSLAVSKAHMTYVQERCSRSWEERIEDWRDRDKLRAEKTLTTMETLVRHVLRI